MQARATCWSVLMMQKVRLQNALFTSSGIAIHCLVMWFCVTCSSWKSASNRLFPALRPAQWELEWHSIEHVGLPPPGWRVYALYPTDRPDLHPDLNQNRSYLSLSRTQPVHQISSESVYRPFEISCSQMDIQTNKHKLSYSCDIKLFFTGQGLFSIGV